MGSGKTVVGKALARLTGRSMVDADEELVRRAGRPISLIFQEDGEAAFRELERSVIVDLCSQSGTVIAAGGGSFVDPDNRELMLANGLVVCLSATPETILKRISEPQMTGAAAEEGPPSAAPVGEDNSAADQPVRPLLAGDDPLARIKALLAQRAEAYALAHYTIETDELTPEQVAEKVLELCRTGDVIEEKT